MLGKQDTANNELTENMRTHRMRKSRFQAFLLYN